MCGLGLILEEFYFGEVGTFHCLGETQDAVYTSSHAWKSSCSPSNICPLVFLADRLPS